jgi:hypothetical protein
MDAQDFPCVQRLGPGGSGFPAAGKGAEEGGVVTALQLEAGLMNPVKARLMPPHSRTHRKAFFAHRTLRKIPVHSEQRLEWK